MSEQDKSDGPLIGILVVLVLLVLGAVGVFGLTFVRMSRVAIYESDEAEAARQEAVRQAEEAEAARADAEAYTRALTSQEPEEAAQGK